jgi:hypothetical protein
MKLELTKLDPLSLLDLDTYDTIMSGRMTEEIVKMNLEIFEGCEIISVNNVTYAISTDGYGRKFLNPFRVRVGTKQYRYAFLCLHPSDQELFWFFKGISKTRDRQEALNIYDALVEYCAKLDEPYVPLMIKK